MLIPVERLFFAPRSKIDHLSVCWWKYKKNEGNRHISATDERMQIIEPKRTSTNKSLAPRYVTNYKQFIEQNVMNAPREEEKSLPVSKQNAPAPLRSSFPGLVGKFVSNLVVALPEIDARWKIEIKFYISTAFPHPGRRAVVAQSGRTGVTWHGKLLGSSSSSTGALLGGTWGTSCEDSSDLLFFASVDRGWYGGDGERGVVNCITYCLHTNYTHIHRLMIPSDLENVVKVKKKRDDFIGENVSVPKRGEEAFMQVEWFLKRVEGR